jgi:hypothetical protein
MATTKRISSRDVRDAALAAFFISLPIITAIGGIISIFCDFAMVYGAAVCTVGMLMQVVSKIMKHVTSSDKRTSIWDVARTAASGSISTICAVVSVALFRREQAKNGLAVLFIALILDRVNKGPPSKRFPGPKQVPFIGRVHDLPRRSMWLKLKEWGDQYGPIYQTSMMGQKIIVVSDEDTANELLIKRGNSFSGRAQIRAIINHKEGPVYVALQDRHGKISIQYWNRFNF